MFEGRNLFERDKNRMILVEDTAYGYDKLAIIHNNIKYLFSPGDNVYWKFNLQNDPQERCPELIKEAELKEIINTIEFKSNIKPILHDKTALGKIVKL
jgi:hypothetical protein